MLISGMLRRRCDTCSEPVTMNPGVLKEGSRRTGRRGYDYAVRVVGEEILDGLDPESPEAIRNRRELRWLNALMGNFGWFRKAIRASFPNGGHFLEMGAGDGALGQYLNRQIPGIRVDGLDLWPRPQEWPEGWGWMQEDLVTFDRYRDYQGVLCNLILHQFEDAVLTEVGKRIRAAGIPLIAAEPWRGRWPAGLIRLAYPLLGPVSRHDALVSIRAGFRTGELGRLLDNGTVVESVSVMGTIRILGGASRNWRRRS